MSFQSETMGVQIFARYCIYIFMLTLCAVSYLIAVALRRGLLLGFRAPLALGQVHGVSGPVVHQLVQVVGERALPALGRNGRRLRLVLPLPRSAHCVCAVRP